MVTTIVISILTIIAMILSILVFPKVKIGKKKIDTYWIVTLIGALALLIFNRLDIGDYMSSLTEDSAINPIKIIVLFFSMTLLSIFLEEAGFFSYIAGLCVNKAKSSQISLFTILFFVISILTIFTSNDIIILVFTPFICYFTKHTNINPIPYLIGEFIAANTLSMSFLIGNPTNIYLSLSSSITFMDYFKVMFIRSLIICFITYGLLFFIFRKELKKPIDKKEVSIDKVNRYYISVGLIHLILCTILLAISSYIDIEMYLLSLLFALSLIIFIFIYEIVKGNGMGLILKLIKRLPFALVPFLFSMFAIVSSLTSYGVVEKIIKILSHGNDVIVIGYTSFFSCSFMNNIPMSVLFSNVLNNGLFSTDAIYAAIAGSNLGALLSPVGALAGIMWIGMLNSLNVKLKIKDFIKYAAPISIVLMTIFMGTLIIF